MKKREKISMKLPHGISCFRSVYLFFTFFLSHHIICFQLVCNYLFKRKCNLINKNITRSILLGHVMYFNLLYLKFYLTLKLIFERHLSCFQSVCNYWRYITLFLSRHLGKVSIHHLIDITYDTRYALLKHRQRIAF